jgi:hypothetical protein
LLNGLDQLLRFGQPCFSHGKPGAEIVVLSNEGLARGRVKLLMRHQRSSFSPTTIRAALDRSPTNLRGGKGSSLMNAGTVDHPGRLRRAPFFTVDACDELHESPWTANRSGADAGKKLSSVQMKTDFRYF